MFPSPLCATLSVFAVCAVVVFSAPSLTVKTSISTFNGDGSKNLTVTATIVNTGNETLKLLNDPRGVLNPFPENTFTITNPSGSSPSFSGAKVNYSPTRAAGVDDLSIFIVLAPGDSIDVIHDLSAAYDFTQSGAGNYVISPSNRFTYVDIDGTPKDLSATVEGITKVKLSGDLTVSQRVHNKRAAFTGCSAIQQASIITAAYSAQSMVVRANLYMKGISTGTDRYKTWFGAYHRARKATVWKFFRNLNRNTAFPTLHYDCTCNKKGITAETWSLEPWQISICPDYWKTSASYQAMILINEAAHFQVNGRMGDTAIGSKACKELASTNPAAAVRNADSYVYFAKNRHSLP